MSLHPSVGTFRVIETFQPSEFDSSPILEAPQVALLQIESPPAPIVEHAKYLPNGAKIISFDEQSNTALCTQDEAWWVWLLDADGQPVRCNFFKSLRSAAYDYAERVMGYHPVCEDVEPSDQDE